MDRKACGFTLVELIFVMVILGLVSALSSSFVVAALDAYTDNNERNLLIQRGRTVLEQMGRRIRNATPNSIRVSASGNCLELLPNVAGAYYIDDLPDAENGAAAVTSITTGPFTTGSGSAVHVLVAPLFSSEVYASGTPGARATLSTAVSGSLTLSSAHTFLRNSPTRRVFVADNPIRFCLLSNQLVLLSDYGFSTAALSDSSPGGTATIMSEGVSTGSQAFTLTAGSENRNAAVEIVLSFSVGSQTVALNHQVLIRNVP